MENVVIGRAALDKINYYVQKAKFEISGLGNVQIINGVPTVTDIILLKQTNEPTETEIDADAISKALYDHHISGVEGELKFWWHSHVDMGAFWSKTDMDTIKELTENGWFIHGVFNKKEEFRLAYSNNEPMAVFLDDLDMLIDEDLISEEALELKIKMEQSCDDLFNELVTDKPYIQYKPAYYGAYDYKESYKGKLQASSETRQKTGSFPATSNVQNIGKCIDKDFSQFVCEAGAIELFNLGYDFEEIEFMQVFMDIRDTYDYEWHNLNIGNVDAELKERIDFVVGL